MTAANTGDSPQEAKLHSSSLMAETGGGSASQVVPGEEQSGTTTGRERSKRKRSSAAIPTDTANTSEALDEILTPSPKTKKRKKRTGAKHYGCTCNPKFPYEFVVRNEVVIKLCKKCKHGVYENRDKNGVFHQISLKLKRSDTKTIFENKDASSLLSAYAFQNVLKAYSIKSDKSVPKTKTHFENTIIANEQKLPFTWNDLRNMKFSNERSTSTSTSASSSSSSSSDAP